MDPSFTTEFSLAPAPVGADAVGARASCATGPTRVAALGVGDADVLVALGIIPVIAQAWEGPRSNRHAPGGGRPHALCGATARIEPEQIAEQHPDLIVAVNTHLAPEMRRRLEAIAPVVRHADQESPWLLHWRDVVRRIGVAVGMEDRAEQAVAEAEDHLERARRTLRATSRTRTAAFARVVGPGTLRVYAPGSPRGRLLTDLGLHPTPSLRDRFGSAMGVDVAACCLELVDADLMIVENPEHVFPAFADVPEWSDVRAVGLERVLGLDAVLRDAVSTLGPLTLPAVVDEFVERIRMCDEDGR